jgi:RNA polymerase sigma-70 factor (ECF subfamily)
MPFHLWIRARARDQYLNERRFHLAARRDVRRDVWVPDSSSIVLANQLVAAGPCPWEAVEARERVELLSRAIDQLKDTDREVLLLRHVEDLGHAEIACLLGVSEEAARQRYGRALDRLSRKAAGLGATGGRT